MNISIKKAFPEGANDQYIAPLGDAVVKSVNVTDGGKRMLLNIQFDEYISRENIFNAELALRELYKFSSVKIAPVFKPEHFGAQVMDDEVIALKRKLATVNGAFTGAVWSYDKENSTVTARLAFDSRPMLEATDFREVMRRQLHDEFGVDVAVKLTLSDEQPSADSVVNKSREVVHKMAEERRREREAAAAQQNAQKPPRNDRDDTPPWERRAQREETVQPGVLAGLPSNVTIDTVVWGRPTKTPLVRISELSPEYTRTAVWGKVFNYSTKDAKSGKYVIVSFCLTDYTSSVTIKLLMPKKDEKKLEPMKDGIAATVHGEYLLDSFEHDYTIKAKYIAVGKVREKEDTSEQKRVELHIHSNMSRMDAIPPASKIVERAVKWGHKAVAITDHGVVQSFPDAMNAAAAAKKAGTPIKILYGTEAYFVNDVLDIVQGTSDQPLDGRFVVFDLETTGLSPQSERITEIGAVRFENGVIGESFNIFVNPEKHIPAEITTLTGITDEMVKDAPSEAEAVRQFLDFIGEDTVLVAHNAGFDTGFINAACERCGYEFHNPYIDTLALSRAIYPELTHHKLDNLVKYLHLPDFEHHRAKDDALALAQVFERQVSELSLNYNAHYVNELNSVINVANGKKLPSYHMIILARNHVGLKNLYRLISTAHVKNFYKSPRILKSELIKYREGLIIGSACEAGELYEAVRMGSRWNELLQIASFYDYLEIQPTSNNAFMIRKGMVANEDALRELNKTIIKLGDKLGKPVVATTDAHYLDPQDDIFRRILISQLGMSDADIEAKLYFRTTDEMLEEFAYLGKKKALEVVVTNTNLIADMVEDFRPIPNGTFPPSIEGSDDNLRSITRGRAREIYGDPLPEYVEERLERELHSIISNGYSIMYMTAQLLVADSVAHGYQVGSRGSVGSSFVATMAGISEVNPLAPHYVCPECQHSEFFINDMSIGSGFDLPAKKCPNCGAEYNRDGHDIPFETFLGFNGDKQPDIDLNFANEYQSSAHRYTETLFNTDTEEKVFKAGTIGTVAEKMAFNYVKKYEEKYGLHFSTAEVERLKRGCMGVKSTTGQHPGGMVVVPVDNEVYDFCPIQHPADKSEVLTTHFDFHAIHDTILKLDCLGHVGPTIYKYLEEFTGIKVTDVTMSDDKVMSLFHSPEALGVTAEQINWDTGTLSLPEVGTGFVKGMLLATKPKTFSDLLQLSGLSHGTGVYLGNAKDLIESGQCTIAEVIGTRDNIMTYLIKKGVPNALSFKIMEIVRKGKSKKLLTDEMVDEMKAHDVPQWYIDSCFKIQYMFPKAHAAAYMISCLRLGWYKVHQPVAYYAAYFTARCKNFDADAAVGGIERAKEMMKAFSDKDKDDTSQTEEGAFAITQIIVEALARGIKFLSVDLYKSDALKFLPEDGNLRLPFVSLKGLGEAAAINLARASKQGDYLSRDEIARRAGVSKSVVDTLAQAGALGDLPESSQLSFNLLDS